MKEEKAFNAIYLLDSKLKFKTYKELQKRIVRDSGPTPKGIDKIIWEMMRDKQIYCWFDPLIENDMGIGLKLPKGRNIKVITNPN